MKLTSLQIERFGARSNLQLDGLSDQLNVIYGPNGSGKSTIISFIRWMLYGSTDDASRHFLLSPESRLGGTLRLVDGHQQRRRVERYHDPIRGDQVRVVHDEPGGAPEVDPRRLTGVDLNEYGHVFCFGFDQPPSIERLIEVTQARDLALAFDSTQMQRLKDLTARRDSLRREEMSWPAGETLQGLRDRRRQLLDDLQAAEGRYHERLRQLQREMDAVAAEIASDRGQLESLQGMLRRSETTIETRRRQLDEAAAQAHQTRERWLDERRQEVAELDFQIQQWHNVLEQIRQRHEGLLGQLAPQAPLAALSTPTDEAELRLFLRSLGYQIDDIEQDFSGWEAADEVIGTRSQGDYLRNVLGTALSSMRDDVHRLCRELQRQQANARYHDRAREQDHLRRCEAELTGLIDALSKRRQSLLSTPEYRDTPWIDPVLDAGSLNGTAVIRPWYEHPGNEDPGRLDYGASRSDPRYGLSDPVLEARLAHLIRRRDHLAARVSELALRVDRNEQHLAHLRGGNPQVEEARHLEALRRALGELDQRISDVEQRQRRRDEQEALERQIDELRRHLGPSEILREASSLLHRLTDGAYRVMRLSDRHETWIEDQRGHALEYRELSRGTRDQVYLSLALALVAAYRRRGVELPMVLNDVFINIDTERAQATAELLAHFASRGHQLILFTRHEHVIQRFTSLRAKLYTLRERSPLNEPSRPLASPPRELPARADSYYLDQVPISPGRAGWDAPPPYRGPEPSRRERPYDWVAHWDPPRRPAGVRHDAEPLVEGPRSTLSEDSLLVAVDWLNRQQIDRLRDVGVQTLLQFLELDPADAQQHLADFSVSASTFYRWQSILSLQCYVGLTASDAGLLVACGVDDPEELSYIDVSQLHRRIEEFLANPESRNRFGSIARFERSRLARWIQAARRSHYRRQHWARVRPGRAAPQRAPQAVAYRPEATERLAPRARRVEPPRAMKIPEPVEAQAPAAVDREETLRFFLEPSDPIVDGPSIGPKTAERFHAIGVTTVAELLELDPADAAERINYRRITAELIRDWQLQTSLVCRVPNLRGHDAQLLVACEVPGPEQLAKMEPETLLAQVARLLETAEGKRILRSAKAPDLAEVTAWIRWAKSARQLQLT